MNPFRLLSLILLSLALVLAACNSETKPALPDLDETLESLAVKEAICHYQEDSDSWKRLNLPSKAAQRHQANHEHDGLAGSDAFDESCNPLVETIFAIAYSNLNGEAGFQEGEDVLISKLVDDNNDGILNAGDQVIMGQYPLNFNPSSASDFGDFGVSSHEVVQVFAVTSTKAGVSLSDIDLNFQWEDVGTVEYYQEDNDNINTKTFFVDQGSPLNDIITTATTTPSQPGLTPRMENPSLGDDAWFEVDIFLVD